MRKRRRSAFGVLTSLVLTLSLTAAAYANTAVYDPTGAVGAGFALNDDQMSVRTRIYPGDRIAGTTLYVGYDRYESGETAAANDVLDDGVTPCWTNYSSTVYSVTDVSYMESVQQTDEAGEPLYAEDGTPIVAEVPVYAYLLQEAEYSLEVAGGSASTDDPSQKDTDYTLQGDQTYAYTDGTGAPASLSAGQIDAAAYPFGTTVYLTADAPADPSLVFQGWTVYRVGDDGVNLSALSADQLPSLGIAGPDALSAAAVTESGGRLLVRADGPVAHVVFVPVYAQAQEEPQPAEEPAADADQTLGAENAGAAAETASDVIPEAAPDAIPEAAADAQNVDGAASIDENGILQIGDPEPTASYTITVRSIDPQLLADAEVTSYYAGGDFYQTIATAETLADGRVFAGWTASPEGVVTFENAAVASTGFWFENPAAPETDQAVEIAANYEAPVPIVQTEAPTEKVTEAPTEKVTEAPTEKVTEAPTEKVTEAPTEKVTEKVTEAPTEKGTEAPVPAETAEEQNAPQAEAPAETAEEQNAPQADEQESPAQEEGQEENQNQASNAITNGNASLITINKTAADENESITIKATQQNHATIEWKVTKSDNSEVAVANKNAWETSFTMPAEAVTVNATVTPDPSYTLTVNSGSGAGTYYAGEVVTISANAPADGYRFASWSLTSGQGTIASATASTTNFTVSSANAAVTANYELIPYTLTVKSGTGSGTYTVGTGVDITPTFPASGKEFDSWETVSGKITFEDAYSYYTSVTMKASDATIKATYKDGPSADSNKITGLENGAEYLKSTTLSFTAVGAGMDNTDPNPGDYRYRPTGYQIGGVSGSWTASPYSTSMAINAVGDYTLTVTYAKDVYDGSSWNADGTTVTKSITFHVVNALSVQTGDTSPLIPLAIAGGAALVVIIALVVVLKKRKKS